MQKEKSCGCVIINGNNVLLIKHNAGHWDFPKGHIEENETEEQTALREVKEETNLDVEVVQGFRYVIQYSPKENVIKDVVLFIAKNTSSDIKPQESEVCEVQWFDIEEAIEKITYNESKNVLKRVKLEYMNNDI